MFIKVEEAGIPKNYCAIVPIDHCLEADAFMDAVTSGMTEVIGKEMEWQRGIKFTPVLTTELDKLTLSVAQMYDDDIKPDEVTTLACF